MCSANLLFQDIVARWHGFSHDIVIFANSSAKFHFGNIEFGNEIVLGDSGYEQSSYLLTPFQEPNTPAQRLYNEYDTNTKCNREMLWCVETTLSSFKHSFKM
ncbi:unnamed protein product, partial [Brenthis ino]